MQSSCPLGLTYQSEGGTQPPDTELGKTAGAIFFMWVCEWPWKGNVLYVRWLGSGYL